VLKAAPVLKAVSEIAGVELAAREPGIAVAYIDAPAADDVDVANLMLKVVRCSHLPRSRNGWDRADGTSNEVAQEGVVSDGPGLASQGRAPRADLVAGPPGRGSGRAGWRMRRSRTAAPAGGRPSMSMATSCGPTTPVTRRSPGRIPQGPLSYRSHSQADGATGDELREAAKHAANMPPNTYAVGKINAIRLFASIATALGPWFSNAILRVV
jgi:hypothetical protein